MKSLKKAHESKDLAAIDSAMEKINQAWQAASEEMYKATQKGQPKSGDTEKSPNADRKAGGDDVTDVEFEEVKDDK